MVLTVVMVVLVALFAVCAVLINEGEHAARNARWRQTAE